MFKTELELLAVNTPTKALTSRAPHHPNPFQGTLLGSLKEIATGYSEDGLEKGAAGPLHTESKALAPKVERAVHK